MGFRRGFILCLLLCSSAAFQSDELLVDDDEFEGTQQIQYTDATRTRSPAPPSRATSTRRRFSDPDSDSKVQFQLDHAFGDSDFAPAGLFTARLKTSSHGGQSLTKLRFSRNAFTEEDQKKFTTLLQEDGFYSVRLTTNVLKSTGESYVYSSVKARCLPRGELDEHFVIHMDGVNILAVNYGTPGACPFPRQLKLPSKWSFNSFTFLKSGEQAPRTPVFADDILVGEAGEGEDVKPPEKSFWAKYWMYLIPLGLIVMNAITQAMNMAEEQAGGQAAGQAQPQQSTAAVQRGPGSSAVRRR
ncbi:ER membrane protein complex subunit 10 [Momordica charantia]|uniref:ER membrane protein complex subunit 10 n=1 Tax=Momordica charantia TaxID=3673 RepID=A0A6J1DA53_MOMCH|nr:ER membrane protein complex subunit 10 [Momordica charantia]